MIIVDPIESSDFKYYCGQLFRDYRKEACLTQVELEKITGISKSSVSNFERGGSVPDLEELCLLFRALEMDVHEYLDDILDKFSKPHGCGLIPRFNRNIPYGIEAGFDPKIINDNLNKNLSLPKPYDVETQIRILAFSWDHHCFDPSYPLPKFNSDPIYDKFFKIKRWTRSCLNLYVNVVHLLDDPIKTEQLTDRVMEDEKRWFKDQVIEGNYIALLVNSAYFLIKHAYFSKANFYLDVLSEIFANKFPIDYMNYRVEQEYLRYFLQAMQGNEAATIRMSQVILKYDFYQNKNMNKYYTNKCQEDIKYVQRKGILS